MQRTAEFAPFPWGALEPVDPRAEAKLWIARRWLERGVDPGVIGKALGTLLGREVRVSRGAVRRAASGHWLKLGFRPRDGGAMCTLGLEPALAGALLSVLFERNSVLSPNAELGAAALGALSALVIEVARSTGASGVLEPCAAHIGEDSVTQHATVMLADKPYAAVVWITPERLSEPSVADADLLRAVADVEIALPLVVGLGTTTPRALAALTPGAAFCAGDTWIDRTGVGRAILASGASEHGVSVELGPAGRIVLGEATRIALASAEEASMASDDASGPPTLAQAVLDAPVVVRVELGSVSMSAREWAALRSGDVIQCGRRLGEPVLLRSGGRILGRGELVNVEGELGVRVIELGSDSNA